MRKLRILGVLLCVPVILAVPVSAHQGKTDANDGHIDSSTGEYHYHHGYPAHSHWDKDGDGDIDCPYDFDDQTADGSASSSSELSFAGGAGSEDSYELGYEKGQEDGYNIGYDSGWDDGNKSGYADGYDQAEADLEEKYDKEVKDARTDAITAFVLIGTPLIYFFVRRKLRKERDACQEEIKKADKVLRDKYNFEVLRQFAPGVKSDLRLPDGVWLDAKCIPIKGDKSPYRPFGDYTVYTSSGGKKYHYRRGCSGATQAIHLFERAEGLMPCANCAGTDPDRRLLPAWYCQLEGIAQDELEEVKKPQLEQALSKNKTFTSSCISKAEFENGVVYVTFKDGGVYAYYNVPEAIYDGLAQAQSPGKYFHEKISGVYPYTPYHE